MKKSIRTARNARKNNGFALSSVAAILTVASLFCFLICALSMNAYSFYNYNGKAQVIAEECAKLIGHKSYFLGARRPMFQTNRSAEGDTKKLAQEYAEHLAQVLHIPAEAKLTVKLLSNEIQEKNLSITKVEVELKDVPLPFNIAGVLPNIADLNAVGVATGESEAPPAFIRFGFKLIDPSQSNPSVTDATQVVMLPAYGFQTDTTGIQNLGGTQNNNDVVGNQPDSQECLWAGINASPNALRSDAPFVSGPDGRQVKAFN